MVQKGKSISGFRRCKLRNPDSIVPFNHYAKHTRLKRRIFQKRREVLEGTRYDPATARHVREQVRALEDIYTKIDAAIRSKEYWKARRLKGILRHRRAKLRRFLIEKRNAHNVENTEGQYEEDEEDPDEHREKDGRVYSSFHPDTTLLLPTASMHPDTAIDTRTGRYPTKLDAASIKAIIAACDAQEESATAAQETVVSGKLPKLVVARYCRNVITDQLDDLAFTVLQALFCEQRDLRKKKPLHFSSRMKYVSGLQETMKYLRSGRLKLVLLAADIEVGEDGCSVTQQLQQKEKEPPAAPKARRRFQSLDEGVRMVMELCDGAVSPTGNVSHIPCVTCLSRKRMSYALFAKGSSISCVGILGTDRNTEALRALRLYGARCLDKYLKRE